MLGVGLGLTSRAGPQGRAAGPGPDGPLVFALLGQSNMIGRAAFDGGSVHPAGVQQWGRAAPNDNTLIPAVHPLDHVDPSPGHMGLDISFAEAVLAARPEASLVFVPGAEGGTGFQSDHWRPGGNCYVDAVTRIDAALAALPGASLAGILWHQGESDAGNPVFQADLDGLITGLRQDITAAGSATPFILGGLVPGWVAADPARQPIQAVLEDTPRPARAHRFCRDRRPDRRGQQCAFHRRRSAHAGRALRRGLAGGRHAHGQRPNPRSGGCDRHPCSARTRRSGP